MASKTTNYNMNKIDLTDAPPDITVLNENFDITDSELNNHATAIADLQAGGGTANLEAKVGETSDAAGTSSTGTVFGKLNKLISDLVTHMSRWSAAKANYLDASISSRAPANTALSTAIWTNTRATYLDNVNTYSAAAYNNTTTLLRGALNGSYRYVIGNERGIVLGGKATTQLHSWIGRGVAMIIISKSGGDPSGLDIVVNLDGVNSTLNCHRNEATQYTFYFTSNFRISLSNPLSGEASIYYTIHCQYS